MTDKCTHETSIVLFCEGDVTISRCTWLCGEMLISTLDGITTTTRTVEEVKADALRLEELESQLNVACHIKADVVRAAAKWTANNG